MVLSSDFQDLMNQLDISPETANSNADMEFSSKLGANTMDHLTSRLKVSDESETYVCEEQGIKYFDILITLIADNLFSCVDIDAVAEERMAGFKSSWIYLLCGYFKLVELAYTEKDHPILKPLKPYLDSSVDKKWMCTSVIEPQPGIPEIEFETVGNGQISIKDPVSVVMAACLDLVQPSSLKKTLVVFILKEKTKIKKRKLEKKIEEAKSICDQENTCPGSTLVLLKQYPQHLWSPAVEEELAQYSSFVYIKCGFRMGNWDTQVPVVVPEEILYA